MNKEPSVKILVGYHKPSALFKSDVLVPIQGGRASLNEVTKDGKLDRLDIKWLLNNTIGDDTGDNISKENRYINEMSCIYWAWKNYDQLGNPDYIGFMQYGKHLIFDPYMEIAKKEYSPEGEAYCYELDEYQKSNNLLRKTIIEAIEGYDCLCTYKYDDSKMTDNISTCKDAINILSEGAGNGLFDFMCQYIKEKHPSYTEYVEQIEKGSLVHPFNCFVMKKGTFFAYCDFLFDVLLEVLKHFNTENLNPNQKRAPGFLSELLTSIFIFSIENKLKIKKCRVAVIQAKTDIVDVLLWDKLERQYLKYKILSKLVFGKKRQKYEQRKANFRARLKTVRRFLED